MSEADRHGSESGLQSGQTCRECGRLFVDAGDHSSDRHGSDNHSDHSSHSDGQGDNGSADAPFMLDPFDADADGTDTSQPDKSQATRAPRIGRWAVLAGVLVLGLAGYGIGLLTASSGTDGLDQAQSDEESDAVFDRDEAGLFGDENDESGTEPEAVSGEAEVPSGDPNFPPSDEHLEAEEISSLFTSGRLGDTDYAVAYVAEDGLHTLGPWGTAQPTVETAHTLDQALGNPLISDGSRTWAIDDATPDKAYIVSARFEVVETELSGNLAFIRKEEDQIEIGLTAYGGRQPGVRIPRASDVLAVPGRGLLVAPATGGTFTVGPDGGMVLLSDDRVVSAGLDSEVYQRCDDTLSCELYASVVNADGVRVVTSLDFQGDTPVTMSPDGTHIVGPSQGEGSLRMVEAAETSSVDLGDYTVLATGWAPDSSFLAVAVPGELLVVPIDGGEILSIPLAADPSSGELLIFEL